MEFYNYHCYYYLIDFIVDYDDYDDYYLVRTPNEATMDMKSDHIKLNPLTNTVIDGQTIKYKSTYSF